MPSAVLVDTNVILDVSTDDPQWGEWSREALQRVAEDSVLVINPIIYAEVSVAYKRIEDLELALPEGTFLREPLPYPAAFLAGKAFLQYKRRGGKGKQSPLPDFFIGAHAAVSNMRLLTRDASRYRTYFPRVQLIAPR
jgi:predicted nucleic acid-binding protein